MPDPAVMAMPDPHGGCKHPPLPHKGGGNWVTQTGGHLPMEIECVARALYWNRGGTRSVSRAVEMAVGIVRNWAEGKGNVTPTTRVRAAAAIARWEAMRASARTH